MACAEVDRMAEGHQAVLTEPVSPPDAEHLPVVHCKLWLLCTTKRALVSLKVLGVGATNQNIEALPPRWSSKSSKADSLVGFAMVGFSYTISYIEL